MCTQVTECMTGLTTIIFIIGVCHRVELSSVCIQQRVWMYEKKSWLEPCTKTGLWVKTHTHTWQCVLRNIYCTSHLLTGDTKGRGSAASGSAGEGGWILTVQPHQTLHRPDEIRGGMCNWIFQHPATLACKEKAGGWKPERTKQPLTKPSARSCSDFSPSCRPRIQLSNCWMDRNLLCTHIWSPL